MLHWCNHLFSSIGMQGKYYHLLSGLFWAALCSVFCGLKQRSTVEAKRWSPCVYLLTMTFFLSHLSHFLSFRKLQTMCTFLSLTYIFTAPCPDWQIWIFSFQKNSSKCAEDTFKCICSSTTCCKCYAKEISCTILLFFQNIVMKCIIPHSLSLS